VATAILATNVNYKLPDIFYSLNVVLLVERQGFGQRLSVNMTVHDNMLAKSR
jgi:hypothetical protein